MLIEEEEKVADSWAELAVAVLRQAVEDTQSENGKSMNARSFLASSGAIWLAAALGVSPRNWRRVVESIGDGTYQLEFPIS